MSKILNVETRLEPIRAKPSPLEPPNRLEDVHATLGQLTADLAEARREITQLHQHLRELPPQAPPVQPVVSPIWPRFFLLVAWVLVVAVWATDPEAPPEVARWVQRFLTMTTTRPLTLRTVTPPDALMVPVSAQPVTQPSWHVLEMPAQQDLSPRLGASVSATPQQEPATDESAPTPIIPALPESTRPGLITL